MLSKFGKQVMNEKQDGNLLGKKYDTLDKRDPLRVFLETLYQQLPDDELAASWMMEYGLLPSDEAKKVHNNILERDISESPARDIYDTKLSTLSGKKHVNIASKKLSKTKKRSRNEASFNEASVPNTKKKKIKNYKLSG